MVSVYLSFGKAIWKHLFTWCSRTLNRPSRSASCVPLVCFFPPLLKLFVNLALIKHINWAVPFLCLYVVPFFVIYILKWGKRLKASMWVCILKEKQIAVFSKVYCIYNIYTRVRSPFLGNVLEENKLQKTTPVEVWPWLIFFFLSTSSACETGAGIPLAHFRYCNTLSSVPQQ